MSDTNQTPGSAPTIRLKPIVIKPRTGTPAAEADPTKPVIPGVVPRVVAATPAPEAAPAAEPAPVTEAPAAEAPAATEAAKSKTSRISLDAALVGGEIRPTGPKTIRLKRPTGVSIPGAAVSSAGPSSSSEGQKTLKFKKAEGDDGAVATEGEGGGIVITGEDANAGPEKVNVIFPIIAIASIIVLAVTALVLSPMMK